MGEIKPNYAYLGLNMDSIISEVKPGQVTFAQNAQTAGFEGNMIAYQNEQANELCFNIPSGYKVIGFHNIIEKDIIVYFLVNPSSGASEIGKVTNCIYSTVINGTCLNFNLNYPIQKCEHKITACTTEVYWTDNFNPRRFIDLDNLPFTEVVQGTGDNPCDITTTSVIDCNKLEVQPRFAIPKIDIVGIESEGDVISGDYQFAVQYCNVLGDAYSSYYSVTNPVPIYDHFKVTSDFNYHVGRSIVFNISNIDTTGVFDFINVAVIKTINDITSVDLVGTFQIQGSTRKIVYSGQSKAGVTLTIDDIFEKFPVYDKAGDVTSLQDILVWADMTTTQRRSYQKIASQIQPQWVSYKLPPVKKQFASELNSAIYRGYMRDEVYPLDMVVISKKGYQSDRFHIPGRVAIASDLKIVTNDDSKTGQDVCTPTHGKPRWEVYNTASVLGTDPNYDPDDPCYEGPYQYGNFAYWESTETYPCNEQVWGNLQGQPIRHPKFPDNAVTNHHDGAGNIYPLGIRIDVVALQQLIINSDLTDAEKADIAAIKIVRGNAGNSSSIKAKGLLFNVGNYFKQNSGYFYPNYPFNDLRPDPFITKDSNGSIGAQLFSSFEEKQSVGTDLTQFYTYTVPASTWQIDGDIITAQFQGSFGGSTEPIKSLSVYFDGGTAYVGPALHLNNSSSYTLTIQFKRANGDRLDLTEKLQIVGENSHTYNTTGSITGIDFTQTHIISLSAQSIDFNLSPQVADGDITGTSIEIGYTAAPKLASNDNSLDGFSSPLSQERFTFHSPDTSFYQPFLGTQLKLETVEYGHTKSHFVQVDKHARYRFPSLGSYLTALGVGIAVGFASGTYGVSTNPFSGTAAFTAFQVFNDVVFRLLPKKNMAYQFNSLGNYTNSVLLPNDNGQKIRQLDIAAYLISGLQGVGDTYAVNNYQRESSVYLRATNTLPYPSDITNVPVDNSRFTLGQVGCGDDFFVKDISAYYGSIKNILPDQYGQIYSYDAIDTGFQMEMDLSANLSSSQFRDVFGGDTFINKFALKRKFPFFIDNRVNFPDDSDVFYDELGNVGFPRFWFSTDVRRGDGGSFNIGSLFGVKVNNFDCKNSAFFYDAGKIYLFAYGIINFFVESRVNVDLRQAYNEREGDYFPHVGGDVPDHWLQEAFVPIAYDNTYTYNKTFSKQNLENVFTTLPVDFDPTQTCTQHFPNRAIYSERQEDVINYKKNNWIIYRPVAFYDFPLTYGKLTSIDGMETRQLLARFENQTQLYNALLTAATSVGDVYLGQQIFNRNMPPVDFSHTDLGYTGSQHKFLLATEYGHIWVDAKRGDVFQVTGQSVNEISNEGVRIFLTNNLNFRLKESFPDYNIDNNFKGVGLHGVYDNKFHRVIITKLDFQPISSSILYDSTGDKFTLDGNEVQLTDSRYFCDISFSISYSFESKSWISFHSYLPNFYVGGLNKFYTGRNDLGSVYTHNTNQSVYNSFYGEIVPYVLEYPFTYKYQDEILQSVKDYSKVNLVTNTQSFVQTNQIFFNKAIIYNDQQCSGVLNLIVKPKNNLSLYLQYPKYNSDSRDILFVKSDNFYNYNGFWDIVKDYTVPMWLPDCTPKSEDKVLNTSNLDYTNRTFKKYPIRAKDCRIRHILDNRDDVRITSQFISTETQTSYK